MKMMKEATLLEMSHIHGSMIQKTDVLGFAVGAMQ